MMPPPTHPDGLLHIRISQLEAALARLADRVDALEREQAATVAQLRAETKMLQQEVFRKTALLGVP